MRALECALVFTWPLIGQDIRAEILSKNQRIESRDSLLVSLPENGVDIVGYSFPKRAYFSWIPILDFPLATIIPEEKVSLKKVHVSIAP